MVFVSVAKSKRPSGLKLGLRVHLASHCGGSRLAIGVLSIMYELVEDLLFSPGTPTSFIIQDGQMYNKNFC